MGDSATTIFRHPPEQKERWQKEADEWNGDGSEDSGNLSQFIRDMVEAGVSKFDARPTDKEAFNEARRLQRLNDDLRGELEHTRGRVEKLESQLNDSERKHVIDAIRNDPDVLDDDGTVQFDALRERVESRSPTRINSHLDAIASESEGDGFASLLEDN